MTRKDILFTSAFGVLGLAAVTALLVFALAPVERGGKADPAETPVRETSSQIADVGHDAKLKGMLARYLAQDRARDRARARKRALLEHPEEARRERLAALAEARKEQQRRRAGTEPSEPEFTDAEQRLVDRLQAAAQAERHQTVRELARSVRGSSNASLRREAVSALGGCGREGVEEMLSSFGGDVPEVTTEMLEPLRAAIIEEENPARKLELAKRALSALTDEADRDIIRDEVSGLEPGAEP